MGGNGMAKRIARVLARCGRRNDRILPAVTAILRTQDIAPEKGEAAVTKHVRRFLRSVSPQLSPTVTRTENRVIAKLHHAGILRPTEWMRVDELRLRPGFAVVARTDQNEVAVRISVAGARFAEYPAFGRPAKRNQQFSIRPPHDGRKRAVELLIFINNNVLQLLEFTGDSRFRRRPPNKQADWSNKTCAHYL